MLLKRFGSYATNKALNHIWSNMNSELYRQIILFSIPDTFQVDILMEKISSNSWPFRKTYQHPHGAVPGT